VSVLREAFETLLMAGAIAGVLPVLAGMYQAILAGWSMFHTHLHVADVHLPRISVLIPAWNEAAVIEDTVEKLLTLEYPRDSVRITIIDDASTDATPDVCQMLMKKYPENVVHLRREKGGQGKAHTLNHGLKHVLNDNWTEAIMITDADVIFTPSSVRKMARHLNDPRIGAVTGYIKEGSADPSDIQCFIRYEYITATGCSRRAQNVLGFLACLSGGAQLHSVENIRDMGGAIRDETFAEDTHTTLLTQLNGRKAIFEPNAIVYAEEPNDLNMLWKQRKRWTRGNLQLTKSFAWLWGDRSIHGRLGSISMLVIWFSVLVSPFLMIISSSSLLTLQLLNPARTWTVFTSLWLIAGLTFIISTAVAYVTDPESAKSSWFFGLIYPGLPSLALITFSMFAPIIHASFDFGLPAWVGKGILLFSYAWQGLSIWVAYYALPAEQAGHKFLSRVLLWVGGYGPFQAAVTLICLYDEILGKEQKWAKTEKSGKVGKGR